MKLFLWFSNTHFKTLTFKMQWIIICVLYFLHFCCCCCCFVCCFLFACACVCMQCVCDIYAFVCEVVCMLYSAFNLKFNFCLFICCFVQESCIEDPSQLENLIRIPSKYDLLNTFFRNSDMIYTKHLYVNAYKRKHNPCLYIGSITQALKVCNSCHYLVVNSAY